MFEGIRDLWQGTKSEEWDACRMWTWHDRKEHIASIGSPDWEYILCSRSKQIKGHRAVNSAVAKEEKAPRSERDG